LKLEAQKDMQQDTARYWINRLGLLPHPEGGYYKEVFRSQGVVHRKGDAAEKSACTSIHYLLEKNDFSAFHRLASDELWYFHRGTPLHIHSISPDGFYQIYELSDAPTGQLSVSISPNVWFAAELPAKQGFTLVSCAVAPGFDFSEFEMADREALCSQFPQYRAVVERLCR
jgi:uncharacterized protein